MPMTRWGSIPNDQTPIEITNFKLNSNEYELWKATPGFEDTLTLGNWVDNTLLFQPNQAPTATARTLWVKNFSGTTIFSADIFNGIVTINNLNVIGSASINLVVGTIGQNIPSLIVTGQASINTLGAATATLTNLASSTATITNLASTTATLTNLASTTATITNLAATTATVNSLFVSPAGPNNVMVQLAQVTAAGGTATLGFLAIPAGYTSYRVVGQLQGQSTGGNIGLNLNADLGHNYAIWYSQNQFSNTAVNAPVFVSASLTGQNNFFVGQTMGASATTNLCGLIDCTVIGGGTALKRINSTTDFFQAGTWIMTQAVGYWNNNTAVTSIVFNATGGNSWNAVSNLTLYGLP